MVSKPYSNLLELASGESSSFGNLNSRIPRVMTASGIVPDLDDSSDSESDSSNSSNSSGNPRTIVVANQLPIRSERRSDGTYSFFYDEDSLLLQLRDAQRNTEFIYIGCLREEIPLSDQDEVSQQLFDSFRCVPTFISSDLRARFYHGFCKQQLWPLFHYMLPLSPELGGRFDRSLWQSYVSANKIFADKILEILNPDGEDFVWVHDYHLMVLPTFLRKRFPRVKLGFFLHSPFPSSEIYRSLPVRTEILRCLLNADLIGFHTFDYARHFLSCCSRMLGLSYHSRRGYICLEYYGRSISIKILPVGVHMGQLSSALAMSESVAAELVEKYPRRGLTVLLGVDDTDIFKGISLKLLAFEQLLVGRPEWRGKAVLVQIANPARGRGPDIREVQHETRQAADRINATFGEQDYTPVVLVDRAMQFSERMAYYTIAECCLVTAVRDGMNLIPYEYIVARQGNEQLDTVLGLPPGSQKKSMLVVSEFIGCSPSLSGAIRVNPWNLDEVADAMALALEISNQEKYLRHEKHYRYVSTHDVGYWANSFLQDLERTCKDHIRRRCWGIGFGLGFRVVALDPSFRKLAMEHIVSAYKNTKTRAILLDYDGTLMPQDSLNKSPSSKSVEILNSLCNDRSNVVFIVSARTRGDLSEWFSPCENLGMAAEHGFFFRLKRDMEWENREPAVNCSWKQTAEPVMKLYTETTDGSTIEDKETALVWCYEDADSDFGSTQAKELMDHLEGVLANDPVSVKSGPSNVEVKPQGVNKGLVAERLLSTMKEKGLLPDFVLCIGDDRSDEDMFEVISNAITSNLLDPAAEIFACTVGRKPSKAKYYLDDTAEILRLMQGLASVSDQTLTSPAEGET